MQKKVIFGLLIIIVSLVLISTVVILNLPKQPEKLVYSDDPKTWVIDKPGGVKEVSVDKVTKGESYTDFNGQQYVTSNIGTVFSYEGWYKGQQFRREFIDSKGQNIMKISQNMKPYDGVIEGFIVERIEGNKVYAYIFLDEDWKNKVDNTRIYWGKTYQLDKDFDFSSTISPGVYTNKIEDDPNRFENNYNIHQGGIWVGDLKEETGSTVISFS